MLLYSFKYTVQVKKKKKKKQGFFRELINADA